MRRFPHRLVLVVLLLLTACASTPPAPTEIPAAPTDAPTPAAVAPTVPPTTAPTAAPTVPPTPAPAEGSVEIEAQGLYLPRNVRAAFAAGTRSSDGNPGPNYWQNRAEHTISLTLTPPTRTVTATQTLTYTNNSPNPMPVLPIRLYLNARRPEAIREGNFPPEGLTEGIVIDEYRENGEVLQWAPLAVPWQTVKLIRLQQPIPPGGSVTLGFSWHFDLALQPDKEGVIDPTTFYLAYFFPRVSVYNDTDSDALPGWDLEEFTYRAGREVYNDFADFSFEVTVPKNYVVWATGDLQNPDEVLQPNYAQRLQESFTSDEIVKIATPEETQQGLVTTQTDTVTWRWRAENVPDIALGLSDHYMWDAGSVVVDPADGRRASVQAAYPVEATEWPRMVEHGKNALAFGSTEWPGTPYPYSKTTLFVGGADEEYPMMANDSPTAPPGASVDMIAAHELLHSWFPFSMGTDERRYPFMDEGWTTAFEYLYNVEFNGQEQATAAFLKFRSSDVIESSPGTDIPIIFPADATRGSVTSTNAYGRAALGYLALKELMGDEAFKVSLHEFINRWQGKRPLPWDMFNTFNATSDEDLTWFFDRWFFSTNYFDLAIGGVEQTATGHTVTIENIGGIPMPFDVELVYDDDTTEIVHQGPEVWKDSPQTVTVAFESTKQVKQAIVSGGIWADVAPTDNVAASQ